MKLAAINTIKALSGGDSRTTLLKKNIAGTLILKGVSILISFLMVPLTIDFVDPTQYGIWLTLSSLLVWFYFFDIGLTNGFRNRFAEAKAKGDVTLARTFVSTTYAALIFMTVLMLVIVLPVNHFLDWSKILNISESYSSELSKVFIVLIICLALNIISQVFSTMTIADQRPFISSLIGVIGQTASLAAILAVTLTTDHGNLLDLAYILSAAPVLVLIIASIILFATRYKEYAPAFRYIQTRYIKDILGIGGKFFIITTSMLFIFQLMNVIINRVLGPYAVTEYNIAFKYFNMLYMIAVIIINPFWSAFTDAYNRKDFPWMRRMLHRLEQFGLLSILAIVIMYFCADYFYMAWVKEMVTVSTAVNVSVALYTLVLLWANIYMYLINGIGTVRLQLIIYLTFAIIAYPSMTVMCRFFGIPGLLVVPIIVYILQAIAGRIQISKLLASKANGIWGK